METKTSTKGSATIALALGAVLLLIGGGAVYMSQQTPASTTEEDDDVLISSEVSLDTETVTDDDMEAEVMAEEVITDNTTPTDSPSDADVEVAATAETGTYEAYSPEKLALATDGDVVLFFHASWCPSCRALENDVNANLSEIPEDVHILQIDYDTATELKRKYGVVRQHTLVQVDADGNEIKTLTGVTNTLDQVVDQL